MDSEVLLNANSGIRAVICGSLKGDGDDDINKALEGQDILFHTTGSDFRRPIAAKNSAFSRGKRQQRCWSLVVEGQTRNCP